MSIRNLSIYLVILSVIGLAFGVGYISYPLIHGAPESVNAPATDPLAPGQAKASDMAAFGPNAQLTSIIDDWNPYYLKRVKALLLRQIPLWKDGIRDVVLPSGERAASTGGRVLQR